MYHSGLGHRVDNCAFEFLEKKFRNRNPRAHVIGQMIHDADCFDEQFGRQVGWARRGIPDRELPDRASC
jgi:hypothetical protein